MDNKNLLFPLILLYILSGINFTQPDSKNFPLLKGPYLGQKPPGMTPEIFAPGIVCKKNHETVCGFFNNGSLFIYRSVPLDFDNAADSPIPIYITELKNGVWTRPMLTKSPGKPWFHNLKSDSQKKTFYYADWLRDDEGKRTDLDIFRQHKTQSGWSDIERLKYPINTHKFDSWPCASNKGTLYFFSGRGGGVGKTDIYKSDLRNGKHETVDNLGKSVNSKDHDHDPFIDPDEKYLIFCSLRTGGFGKDDLYISYKTEEDSWTDARNMGPGINTEHVENRPYVTPDGKYLFFAKFMNGNVNIYWVDAEIIEKLKPKELKK